MPRYYLHIRDGQELIRDHEGIELPSIVSALGKAEEAARALAAEKHQAGDIIDARQVEIHDNWGNRMITVPVSSVLRQNSAEP